MTTSPFMTYLSYGWSVLPLRARDKLPDADLLPQLWDETQARGRASWKPYQETPASVATVSEWLRQKPELNVGIVTGAVSGLIVLDLDGVGAVVDACQRGLPCTPVATTGKGLHVYLAHPGGSVRNGTGLVPEVAGYDLRGDGGYVVAPPSVHPSGHRYRWLISPRDATLARPPAWLLDRIAPQPESRLEPRSQRLAARSFLQVTGAGEPAGRYGTYATRALEAELDQLRGTAAGNRNNQLNRAAFCLGQLVAAGLLQRAEIEQALREAARAIGLAEGEATRTIASGLRAGMDNPRVLPDLSGEASLAGAAK